MLKPVTLTVVAGTATGGLVSQMANAMPDRTALVGTAASLSALTTTATRWFVDPDVGSRTPGCDCCALRIDLIDAVIRALRRNCRPHRVIVVASESDDATTIVHTILSDPDLGRLVHLDGLIVTVDAVQLATRLNTGQPVETELGLDRVAIADRILVQRSRDVTSAALGELGHVLRSLNQVAPVIAPAIAPCTLDQLVDIDAWHGAPNVGRPPAEPSPFLVPGTPGTVVCHSDDELDGDRIDEWLDTVIAQHASRLLRLQGAVALPGQRHRTCFHGVRSYAMSHSEADHPRARRSGDSTVVLIGHHLPADALQAEFASARA